MSNEGHCSKLRDSDLYRLFRQCKQLNAVPLIHAENGTLIEEVCTYLLKRWRAQQGSHASWKVLDFYLENSRTGKVLENHFGPGKSWKLKLKVLESPGKISLKVMHFSSGSNGKQAATV